MLLDKLASKINKREGLADLPAPLSENFISNIVVAYDTEVEQRRGGEDYVHVSSLIDMCARQHFLLKKHNTKVTRSVGPADRIVRIMGRAAEAHVRNSFLKATGYKLAYGTWTCDCGKTSYDGLFQHTHKVCPHCKTQPVHYNELEGLVDHEARIIGHADFILYYRGSFNVIEIKSMNKNSFSALVEPLKEHVLQAACYARLLKSLGNVSPQVRVLYVCKDYIFGKTPYREFIAHTGTVEKIVDVLWASALDLAKARAEDTPPHRVMCSSVNCARAKSCPVSSLCFSI